MSSNLLNLLFEKFDKELLKRKSSDILVKYPDNNLSEKNYVQILSYFEEDEMSDNLAKELIRCVNDINWILQNLNNFKNKSSNEEFFYAIFKKLKSRKNRFYDFNELLVYFSDELIKSHLTYILQSIGVDNEDLSRNILNNVLSKFSKNEMSHDLLIWLFEFFNTAITKQNLLNILSKANNLDENVFNEILSIFSQNEMSNDLVIFLLGNFEANIIKKNLSNILLKPKKLNINNLD